jgi:ABC-type Fe3+/spermidine/putrescine transport system ATPase subunit
MTTLEGEIIEVEGNLARMRIGNTVLQGRSKVEEPQTLVSQTGLAMIRPERLRLLEPERAMDHLNQLSGRVLQKVFRGTQTEVFVEIAENIVVKAIVTDEEIDDRLQIGLVVSVVFDPKDTFLFLGQKK